MDIWIYGDRTTNERFGLEVEHRIQNGMCGLELTIKFKIEFGNLGLFWIRAHDPAIYGYIWPYAAIYDHVWPYMQLYR